MNDQIRLTPFYELSPKERAESYRRGMEEVSKDAPPYSCLITNEEAELLRLLKIIEADKNG